MNGVLVLIVSGIVAAVALGLAGAPPADAVDDDLLAHRLYREGRHAEAAELFTDPAWKGVALYRDRQWWRAADAFVRADDARSAYNLGNAYARLGYPELALEAYRRALAIDPALEDARHNADVMRRLLALDDEDESGGRSPSEDEIERIEREREPEERGAPEAGSGGEEDEESAAEERGAGERESGEEERAGGDETAPGDGGDADDAEREASAGDGGGALGGEIGEEPPTSRASGESESARARDDAQAAGLRRELESAQATEQWLAHIAHDPGRFLEKRIALELRRRRAAGRAAPEGGSAW